MTKLSSNTITNFALNNFSNVFIWKINNNLIFFKWIINIISFYFFAIDNSIVGSGGFNPRHFYYKY